MSADQAQREPTMEEILSSIRRIIEEDEDVPLKAGGEAPEIALEPVGRKAPTLKVEDEPVFAPLSAKAPAQKPVDDFELIDVPGDDSNPFADIVIPAEDFEDQEEAEEEEVSFSVDLASRAERAAPPAEAPPPVSSPFAEPPLVGEPVAAKAAGALGRLMGAMTVTPGQTLDGIVRELLKPMLKEWLDERLPELVEAEVAREIDRIRRMNR